MVTHHNLVNMYLFIIAVVPLQVFIQQLIRVEPEEASHAGEGVRPELGVSRITAVNLPLVLR